MSLPTITQLTSDLPVANPDTVTVAAEGSVTFDPLTNDTDAGQTGVFLDSFGHYYFEIGTYSQPVDAQGNQLGELSLTLGPNGYPIFQYTADDPSLDAGNHTLTFQYTLVDENQHTSSATVTINVTGNAIPGETTCGTNHPDTITGAGGNDKLCGGNQDDTINGAGGADTICGDNGKDSLNGGAGEDVLSGGNGEDTLNGGPGDDTLSGGNGHDHFLFDFHFGHDLVTDFDKDTIQVSVADWTGYDDLMAHAVQSGHDVIITSDDGQDTLTLLDVSKCSLHSNEFLFT